MAEPARRLGRHSGVNEVGGHRAASSRELLARPHAGTRSSWSTTGRPTTRARAADGGRRARHPPSVQQRQRRGRQERHPRRHRRVHPHHRRRRPAQAGRCAAPRRDSSASTTSSSARGPSETQAGSTRRLGNAALNRLASFLTERDDSRPHVRVPRARGATYLLEFLHLLPNGFSTPTTTTLAFLKAGYNVAFEPVEARRARRHVEDPALARRPEVPAHHAARDDDLQPAARVPADRRRVVPARRRLRRLDDRRHSTTSRTRRSC